MNFEIRRRYDRYAEYSRTLAADISKMMEYFQKVIPTIFQDYPELAGISIPSSIKLIDTLVDVRPYIAHKLLILQGANYNTEKCIMIVAPCQCSLGPSF